MYNKGTESVEKLQFYPAQVSKAPMRLSKAESVAPEWHLLETIKNLQTPKSEFGALDGPRERQNRGLSQFHTLETISVQKRYSKVYKNCNFIEG